MEKDTYSKNEMDLKWELVLTKLDAIHEQTKRTNGRVSSLETVSINLDKRVTAVETKQKGYNRTGEFWKDKIVWITGSLLISFIMYLLILILGK